jgi:serine protease Do
LQQKQRQLFLQELQARSKLAQNPSTYSGYTRVNDNEDKITLQVPVEWSDIETGEWAYKGQNVGVYVAASADLGNFYSTRSQPGVFLGVSHALENAYGRDGMLKLEKGDFSGRCTYKGRFDFQNQFYVGQYDHYTNCAGGTPNLLTFTTTSADKKSLIFLRIVAVSQADLEAVDKILSSFQVLGDPEVDDHHDE